MYDPHASCLVGSANFNTNDQSHSRNVMNFLVKILCIMIDPFGWKGYWYEQKLNKYR